ncbi:DUF2062 domain-containing protein [Halomonas sp. MCCC 1A17488]|uniref:DUF2062 domain-containing protein n=1 Tax=Billgrantia sulfidoxydans TaxID=2733484 RepID=A0ABX7W2E5_9GAMM|nr:MULTISPECIES: DUF2062 domain-containing protein [Halomonas]MCE8015682.1 DUF2062 domain-containing protein [Halomonas sp. MCCC 1A17488]MCG3239015.1 DUF2062 domain-containing protein [Halomonas sp. MCCC 1A17488]QPP51034.1 DUF2062 domain-containing protein [Halomonas sp. SS10-MC5]QTP54546.1 DUF2062 domain-containing protein [Halomonas sulfidoxydans]
MPRRFLQRYMPNPETLRRQRSLRFMSRMIGDPGLWVLTRRTVANAFSVGMFSAMLPIPCQMVVAALGAWLLRCNLPLSVGLVWITNPLTMPLVFYGNYRIGAWLMDTPAREAPARISTRWIAERMADILPALALGSVATAIVLAILANLLVRLVWRWRISRSWKQRTLKRRLRRRDMND